MDLNGGCFIAILDYRRVRICYCIHIYIYIILYYAAHSRKVWSRMLVFVALSLTLAGQTEIVASRIQAGIDRGGQTLRVGDVEGERERCQVHIQIHNNKVFQCVYNIISFFILSSFWESFTEQSRYVEKT